ncbi:MAG: PilZ domain-containing protein [Nitrospirota bacterium]|nr:PilZ domain-containing protein [Nitrospirota bacterium]
MADTPAERREFIRVPFKTNITVRTPDRTIWHSNTADISLTGLRVYISEPPPPLDTPCEIEIVLSETGEPVIIEARGIIVRSDPGTLAVHVSEIDLDSYTHLTQLILNNAGDIARAEQEISSHRGIRKPPAGPDT